MIKRFGNIILGNGILLMVAASIVLGVILLAEDRYVRDEISDGLSQRAYSELMAKSLVIRNMLEQVESAVDNHVWDAERLLPYPDSMYNVAARLVEQNPEITGSSISFIPDYYPQKGYWFEPYVVRRPNGVIERMQLGGENHDYTKSEFYILPVTTDSSAWVNPYLDSDGAGMILSTYSHPVRDKTGKPVAAIDADISLDWLDSILRVHYVYPSSYHILVSQSGQIMNYPDKAKIMHSTLADIAKESNDTAIMGLSRRMMAGETGETLFTDDNGEKNFVFFSPVGGKSGWSLAVVSSEKDIYGDYYQIKKILIVLMFLGIFVIVLILVRSVKNINKLQRATEEREKAGRELKIAGGIQMGMIPKNEQPESNGVIDISGLIDPAKEVGGDLYDFFVRNDRLYFCIGDVSGKGVPAALLMTVTRSLFRTISPYTDNAAKVLHFMNDSLAENEDSCMFVTMFAGILDLKSGKLNFCNAGHDAPVVLMGTANPLIVKSNLPLGVMEGFEFEGQEISLPNDSTLFLFTDGLTEAMNTRHEEFGDDRMRLALSKAIYDNISKNPKNLLSFMLKKVKEFAKNAPQSDDITMLAFTYHKKTYDEEIYNKK